ncbi:MAG: sigma-70 family RNA polymerase sigma factor [Alphaproteobacteria bacterium]|nr:sigma-70 family RNA polymerase sigma factor [Alphaproteobacteria bacterium]
MRPDEELLRTLMINGLEGDSPSYEALLRALAPVLRAYFGRRLASAAQDADDLVQESLLAIHTRRSTYDRERPFLPWVYAIARYKLVDYFRRRGAAAPAEALDERHAAAGFEEAVAARMDVARLLDSLPAKQRAAIEAMKLRGESVADATLSTGLSAAHVKVSVHRGLKSLAARFRKDG